VESTRLTADGELVIDARGAFVTPRIIDTRLDAMWWNPPLDPYPPTATSMVFARAPPAADGENAEIVDLLCFAKTSRSTPSEIRT
jgi:hypothetical protein